MNNKLRIVFDIDDTICDNNFRDYENAIPKQDVIDKINELHNQGYEIVLHTARGMRSCDGDLNKIIAKNQVILENWLEKNNVKYDELHFGKPLGDLYIDDKCMEVREFVNSRFETLKGGSNLTIERLGKYLIKELGSNENVKNFKKWCSLADKYNMKHQHIVSCLYDRIYLDYVEGTTLAESITKDDLEYLFLKIYNLKTIAKYDDFDIQYHIDNIKKNDIDKDIHERVEKCEKMITSIENLLKDNASFSHGDCILSNIIKSKDDSLYFIDEHWNKDASSYLLDLAKIRMSLEGYDYVFKYTNRVYQNDLIDYFDTLAKTYNIYDILIKLQYMHILRCYRYKSKDTRFNVLYMLILMERKYEKQLNSF